MGTPIVIADNSAFGNARELRAEDLSPMRMRDVIGRVKVSNHQNIYEADFEYGPQPLRWESLVANGGTITHLPGEGGVRMRLPTTAGAATIRQSRPYHRYQPGKTMFMATAAWFGPALTNQVQRIGFFDDSNGCFFEQAGGTPDNPSGMGIVYRSDAGGLPVDTRVALPRWNGYGDIIPALDWNNIQMLFIEYAWYGAGMIRWGVFLNGQPHILHEVAFGNRPGQTRPWSRTGNLPVRYEQRNLGVTAQQNDLIHYGVSVMVEGRVDDQRGFTYSYGQPQSAPRRAIAANASRVPLTSYRGRPMGTVEFTQAAGAIQAGATTTGMSVAGTPFTAGALVGRMIYWPSLSQVARITANTNNSVTYQDNVLGGPVASAPGAGINYQIGLINRGQMLPRRMQLTSTQDCFVEIFTSSPGSALQLTGANFLPNPVAPNSFAEIDTSATAFTISGECVYTIFVPANQPVDLPIDNLFPLFNNIRGDRPDILSMIVTNTTASVAQMSGQIIGQEAMS